MPFDAAARPDRRPGLIGLEAQKLITWARGRKDAVLVLADGPWDADGPSGRLVRDPVGIVAASMATRIVDGAGTDVTPEIGAAVRARLAAVDGSDGAGWAEDGTTTLHCIDHASMDHPLALHHPSEGHPPRDASDLADMFETMIGAGTTARRKGRTTCGDLGRILCELFGNTRIHARCDATGRTYRRSVRSVTLATHIAADGHIDGCVPDTAALGRYVDAALRRTAHGDGLRLFEISVSDAGPGMAATLLGRPIGAMPIEEEFETVRRCFQPNGSSLSRSGRGLGLPRVLGIAASRGGHVEVRTGRLALAATFGPEGGDGGIGTPSDAVSDDGSITALERVEGTTVTVLIPLEAERDDG